jgi:hypothetical protein
MRRITRLRQQLQEQLTKLAVTDLDSSGLCRIELSSTNLRVLCLEMFGLVVSSELTVLQGTLF